MKKSTEKLFQIIGKLAKRLHGDERLMSSLRNDLGEKRPKKPYHIGSMTAVHISSDEYRQCLSFLYLTVEY